MEKRNRVRFEAAGNEADYVMKCITCKHQYTMEDESDTLYCGCKTGCKYKSIENSNKEKTK